MFTDKLRELSLAIGAGRVTLSYPAAPHGPVPGTYRGLPALDGDRCVGCGACANACPSRLISLTATVEAMHFTAELSRCIYCGRCAEVCPTGAMQMTDRFETVVTDPGLMRLDADLAMARCPACGKPTGTTRHMVQYLAGKTPSALLPLCGTCKKRLSAARLKGVRRHV